MNRPTRLLVLMLLWTIAAGAIVGAVVARFALIVPAEDQAP